MRALIDEFAAMRGQLRELIGDDENARLKRIVADKEFEIDALRDELEKLVGPSRRRQAVVMLQDRVAATGV